MIVKSVLRVLGLLLPALASHALAAAPPPADVAALHVLNRAAYGPAPGELAAVKAQGGRQWLATQLHPEKLAEPAELQARLARLETQRWTVAEAYRRASWPAFAAAGNDPEATRRVQQLAFTVRQQAIEARLLRALYSPAQLRERMVEFWFNHFNVFGDSAAETLIWVGAYERDAIRPFVLGRFRDLLGATARHPAMLYYLDNWLNAAPGTRSETGTTGLNENYARELMELHTLGVDGGYTQQDVIALARIFTGWTYDPHALARGVDPPFVFRPELHDTGEKKFLGKRFAAGGGLNEGERALDLLARHPATARRVAYKLVQCFVADRPSPKLVSLLAQRFIQTDGDIRAVLQTLFASQDFWSTRNIGSKFKTPMQFVLSGVRAGGLPMADDLQPLANMLAGSGQAVQGWVTPDGYADTRTAWFNADTLLARADFASGLSMGLIPLWPGRPIDASRLPDAERMRATLGPLLPAASARLIAGVSPELRAGLMLGSPEFMRR